MQFEELKSNMFERLEKELPAHLTYHSVGHIKDVYNAAQQLAKEEIISDADLQLLLTAVLFHDSGFMIGQNDHEQSSCEIAKQTLPAYGYPPEVIARICGMIMATKIPQSPKNLLEQIICDADLDYLGRDDFFPIGDTLFRELQALDVIKTEDEWNRLQLDFLEKHHYFTSTALKWRKAKKAENLESVRSKLKH
ncbi:MAG: phosphohydrolase [Flavipsychrobacter sp.]|jgi:predicted metal-dependent HD superfamily phosphohydrolase|nr:phosphohydrolase [Flavipsychrobacter sp.]